MLLINDSCDVDMKTVGVIGIFRAKASELLKVNCRCE